MQHGAIPRHIERQTPDSGGAQNQTSVPLPVPFVSANEFAMGSPPSVVFDAFINTLERLERLLDLETEMLIQHRPIALTDFNHKKSYGLLELGRTMEAIGGLDLDALGFDAKTPLARLRVKLQRNLIVLQMHMTAVGAIAAIIARAIQEYESDGTYTAELGNSGKPR